MKITKKQLQEAVNMAIEEELMNEGAKMTRQHFQLIADVLKDSHAGTHVIEAFARALEQTNPGFDSSRFMQAAAPANDRIGRNDMR